jgi:hypothetical protein
MKVSAITRSSRISAVQPLLNHAHKEELCAGQIKQNLTPQRIALSDLDRSFRLCRKFDRAALSTLPVR